MKLRMDSRTCICSMDTQPAVSGKYSAVSEDWQRAAQKDAERSVCVCAYEQNDCLFIRRPVIVEPCK